MWVFGLVGSGVWVVVRGGVVVDLGGYDRVLPVGGVGRVVPRFLWGGVGHGVGSYSESSADDSRPVGLVKVFTFGSCGDLEVS